MHMYTNYDHWKENTRTNEEYALMGWMRVSFLSFDHVETEHGRCWLIYKYFASGHRRCESCSRTIILSLLLEEWKTWGCGLSSFVVDDFFFTLGAAAVADNSCHATCSMLNDAERCCVGTFDDKTRRVVRFFLIYRRWFHKYTYTYILLTINIDIMTIKWLSMLRANVRTHFEFILYTWTTTSVERVKQVCKFYTRLIAKCRRR